eukprot:NODE_107_length_18988_cov_0.534491.p17 type:complete len:164 gc:universal NODE_107_length_18988_cov_0.534491:16718-17209(+)
MMLPFIMIFIALQVFAKTYAGVPVDRLEMSPPSVSPKPSESHEVMAKEVNLGPGPVPSSEPIPVAEPENVYEEECEEEIIDTCADESQYPIDEDCIEDVYEDCEGDVGEWQCEEEEYIECDDVVEPIGEYEEDCEEEVIVDECGPEPVPEFGQNMESGRTDEL